jgi:predicted ATPase
VRLDLPSGTVTFLFNDIEGSTRLLDEVGEVRYSEVLGEHRSTLREVFGRHGGVEVDTQGDAFFYAFADPTQAVGAAAEAQEGLKEGLVRVRMGLHTGEPRLTEEGYVGREVHRGARIAAAGHGGQVVLSKETQDLVSVEVTDLGEHRVKDFAEPVWIFQLGSERFPPLKTISNTNLPHPASSFVGREREVREVIGLLAAGARLLALTGPGGSGKTRLAIEAAAELVPAFRNGVLWVGLAPLRDPALVLDSIAQTVGAKDGLAEHIEERQMLLVLDNLEQVVAAAPELASLVEACPNLKVLVTTRELLRVRGEVEYPVPPLADPDAVELFTTRSGFQADEVIAELCRRLDNLPLAVELAAARTGVLSPAQILDRLSQRLDLLKGRRDAEARQQTLRATIEWSHELLSEEEKALFARLAVFVGGCTLDAAEEVARADLDTLQALVDKSLVRHTDERFWMLETIREYAAERLEESGEGDDLHGRHAEQFLALAEEAEPHLYSGSRGAWPDRLEREHDNLRAALDWLEASGQTERSLQMAGALEEFWGVKGHIVEGRRRLENALAADKRPTAARARALNGAADLATASGDAMTARLRAEEGLALHRKLGNAWGTAVSLCLIGIAHNNQGEFAEAREVLDESVRLFRTVGDEHNAMEATRFLAWTHGGLGDPGRERELLEENLRRARALGDKHIEATALEPLGGQAGYEGRVHEALGLLHDAYRLNRELGDDYRLPFIVCRMARALAGGGRSEAAARVLASGEALLQEIGASENWMARRNEETLGIVRQQLDDAAFAEAWEEGTKLTADQAVALAVQSVG